MGGWGVNFLRMQWHMHRHNVLGPGALGRGQNFNFLNMVMWHIKFKGMSSRPGYTKKI